MPWPSSTLASRLAFVTALQQPGVTLSALCRQFGLTRRIGRKWRERFARHGRQGLSDRSRRPRRCPQRLPARWIAELLKLRRAHPRWGARKLRLLLRQRHPRTSTLPSLRSLERWLQQAALTKPRPPRTPPGPVRARPALRATRSVNAVWTVDFKGSFRTADGQRCEALTMRDLASRYVLVVRTMAEPSEALVRRVMTATFRRFGLPRAIRVDNGAPFASKGPLNLSRLSVWWLRLGLRVEFTRRGKPQDNAAHEQMHRILKADTATPPAPNLHAQARRFARWQKQYNQLRPHEALGGQTPAQRYVPSPRRFAPPSVVRYPRTWLTRQVRPCGCIRWLGALRFIGRAFVGQRLGLRPATTEHLEVHLGAVHLGNLHLQETGPMRPCHYQKPRNGHRRPARRHRS